MKKKSKYKKNQVLGDMLPVITMTFATILAYMFFISMMPDADETFRAIIFTASAMLGGAIGCIFIKEGD